MQTICPKCNTLFTVSDKFLGHKARCLKCKAAFVVGKAPAPRRKAPIKKSIAETPDDSERFYTVKDLAEMFNVTTMTIYRMVNRGQLICYQIGRAKRFRPSDIKDFLDNNSSQNAK